MNFDLILLLFCLLSTLCILIWLGLIARQVNASKGIDTLSVPVAIFAGVVVLISLVILWSGYILFASVS